MLTIGCLLLLFFTIRNMQSINYFQLFHELLSANNYEEIVIEVSVFNKFAREIKVHNILCDFDFVDLEDYFKTLPNSRIEYSRIVFSPTSAWKKRVGQLAKCFDTPCDHLCISEVWKEVYK